MSLMRSVVLVVSLFASSLALASDPQPAPQPAPPAVVALFPGWSTRLPADDVARFAVADPSIVTLARNHDGGVVITAAGEGRTLVTVWLAADGAPRTFEIYVESAGWDLVPVLTAAVDIREDSVLTEAMVTVRYLPRAMVSSSVAKPDALRYLLHQPLNVPVRAGDLLLWSEFEHHAR